MTDIELFKNAEENLPITFSEDFNAEYAAIIQESEILNVITYVTSNDEIPEDIKNKLKHLLHYILDLFDVDLPDSSGTPLEILRKVSRDINLSRIIRERGLMRLYRLAKGYIVTEYENTDGDRVAEEVRTYTALGFTSQEELLDWFCTSAGVSRPLVFLRFKTIGRLVDYFEFSLEEAYNIVRSKPSVINKVQEKLLTWEGQTPVTINPDVALNTLKYVKDAETQKEIIKLAEEIKGEENPDFYKMEKLIELCKPAFKEVLQEVAVHDSARDAMKMVKHDILDEPDIMYRLDSDTDGIMVEVQLYAVDNRGMRYLEEIKVLNFIPDTVERVPKEVMEDLKRRLSIRD